MHLKFWGEQTGAENERERRELALSFVAELVYWAYKHDERSLERWTKSSNKSGENIWAYTLMRKAMFGVGGVSRCMFLWTTDAITLTEMRVPHGVLELPRLDSDTREKIRPWIERAGIAVVLREAQPWNGHSRDGGSERDADGDDRQRNRPGPYYGSRPWRTDDHRYRAPRPNARCSLPERQRLRGAGAPTVPM